MTYILPGSPEWAAMISPSKVASILGVSRYTSAYALWHQMRGQVPGDDPERDDYRRGHAFELAMAELWRGENPGWKLSPGEVQAVTDRYGFPAVATIDRRAVRGNGRRVVEFKTARSLEDWGDDFTDEAPLDYVAQLQAQMLFTGYTRQPGHLMVLGPYFRWHTYHIPHDPELAAMMVDRCATFWASLQSGQPPPLDDTVSTYECVRALHPHIDPEGTVELDRTLVAHYARAKALERRWEQERRGHQSHILDAMGDARRGTVSGRNVAIRAPARSGSVSLTVTGIPVTEDGDE
jgi:predicted phage-related endonuclease